MQTDNIHTQNIWPLIDHTIFSRVAKYLHTLAFHQLRSLLDTGSLTPVKMSINQAHLVVRSALKIPDDTGDVAHFKQSVQERVKGTGKRSIAGEINYLLRHQVFNPPHGQIPEDFWSTLTELTWLDLRFQRVVAMAIECEIRSRTFFSRGGFASIILSPCTFWLLTSMACGLTLYRPSRYSPAEPDEMQSIMEALEKLQSVGLAEGLHSQTEWAGLWDQWILREALRSPVPGVPSEIDQALRELPLCMKDYSGKLTSGSNLAAPDWLHTAPQWFKEWEGVA